jgi:quinol monooxygenase YgiN
MIIVTGSVVATPEHADEVLRLSLEHVRRSRLEPGCISHDVHHHAEDRTRLVFVERWADRDALTAHFAVPESRAFARALRTLSSEPTTIELYEATPVQM